MKVLATVPWWLRFAVRRLGQTSTIVTVTFLLIVSVLLGAGAMTVVETAGGGVSRGYLHSLQWFIDVITSVGLGAEGPTTVWGRAVSTIVLLLARVFFGMLTAAIASALINRILMEGKGMGAVALRDHVLICGWNSKGDEIIHQMSHDERKQDIVILAQLENAPARGQNIYFVRGDPALENDLKRASIDTCETAIILADETIPNPTDSTMDARSVLIALTIEKLNPKVYTCAEVRQPENRPHFLRASVDELVMSTSMVADLIARSAVQHGLSHIMAELLTAGRGNELYVTQAPSSLFGKSFNEASVRLRNNKAILIGLLRGLEVIINPAAPVVINEGDRLVFVAWDGLPPL